tara:strand:- start:544 stop:993 length:450 start_codon:yes stop_codon:yes gene_type:complete
MKYILFLFVSISNLFASIGDSELQINQRYGTSNETMKTESNREIWKAYKWSGLIIYVAYLDGVSQMENYKRIDGRPISRIDILSILELNTGKFNWQADPERQLPSKRWFQYNDSGKELAIALYDPSSSNTPMSVMTSAYRDFRNEARKK